MLWPREPALHYFQLKSAGLDALAIERSEGLAPKDETDLRFLHSGERPSRQRRRTQATNYCFSTSRTRFLFFSWWFLCQLLYSGPNLAIIQRVYWSRAGQGVPKQRHKLISNAGGFMWIQVTLAPHAAGEAGQPFHQALLVGVWLFNLWSCSRNG